MIKKTIVIFSFFIFFNPLNATIKEQIILNLEKTNNFTFNFKQTIDEKSEKGSCIIEYPKKFIACMTILTRKSWFLMENH